MGETKSFCLDELWSGVLLWLRGGFLATRGLKGEGDCEIERPDWWRFVSEVVSRLGFEGKIGLRLSFVSQLNLLASRFEAMLLYCEKLAYTSSSVRLLEKALVTGGLGAGSFFFLGVLLSRSSKQSTTDISSVGVLALLESMLLRWKRLAKMREVFEGVVGASGALLRSFAFLELFIRSSFFVFVLSSSAFIFTNASETVPFLTASVKPVNFLEKNLLSVLLPNLSDFSFFFLIITSSSTDLLANPSTLIASLSSISELLVLSVNSESKM